MARTWTVGAAGFLMLAACSFESSSSSGGAAGLGGTESESGETETETASEGTSTTGSGSSPTSDASDPSDPTNDSDTDPTDGSAATVTVEGDNFGNVAYQTTPTRDYTVTNEGEQPTENLALVASGPFVLDSDDCPGALGPGDSCTAIVSHNANTFGPFSGELQIGYDNAGALQTTSQALSVDVVGVTANLIVDPGFEGCDVGISPAGWQALEEGDGLYCGWRWWWWWWWAPPHEGARFLSGGGGPDSKQDVFGSRLDVDLTPYEHAIATGSMTFEFEGYASTRATSNDVYQFRVRYGTANGMTREEFNTDFVTGRDWTAHGAEHTLSDDVTVARIDLRCEKNGGDYCNAYFDTLSLVGHYEP